MAENKVYQIITDQIIAKLEEGKVPWQKPWNGSSTPTNYVSNKPYRGINAFLLSMSTYQSNFWLTFNQAKELGGTVKKGEKSTLVVFWKEVNKKGNNDDENESYQMLRYYRIFNIDQCENVREIKNRDVEEVNNDIEEDLDQEWFIKSLHHVPEINFGGHRAFYSPSEDFIQIPQLKHFENSDEFYAVQFHEIVHSTGHQSRLGRLEKTAAFGNHDYSKEELTAEMGACFLCGIAGIETTFENSAGYIQGWLKKLKSDPKFVVRAAGKAQKAVDYLLDIKHDS